MSSQDEIQNYPNSVVEPQQCACGELMFTPRLPCPNDFSSQHLLNEMTIWDAANDWAETHLGREYSEAFAQYAESVAVRADNNNSKEN